MKNTLVWLVIVVVVGGGVWYFWRGGGSRDYGTPTPSASPRPAAQSSSPRALSVNISGFKFAPDTLTVKKGDTIIFTNNDSATHTVTSAVAGAFESGALAPDSTWTLNTAALNAGMYVYTCSLHPSMRGTLVVQ